MLHEPSRVGGVVDLLPHHRRSRTNMIAAAVEALDRRRRRRSEEKGKVKRGFVGSGGEG
jgi:hypothetical protein